MVPAHVDRLAGETLMFRCVHLDGKMRSPGISSHEQTDRGDARVSIDVSQW
jgi:hypothetical protein